MKRAAAFAFVVFAAGLAFLIDAELGRASAGPTGDPLSRLIGTAEEAVGDTLFLKADSYFHGGAVAHHEGESIGDIRKEGMIAEDDHDEDTPPPPKDWIERINDAVTAHEHRHLEKAKRKEMLPFFAAAAAMDPHNVEAILTSAFWLDSEFGKTQHALEMLEKGAKDNPDSWEIQRALGRMRLRMKDDASAEAYFAAALEKAGDKAERFERVEMFYHLGETRLAQGKRAEALEAYRGAQASFEQRTAPYLRQAIETKIKQLSE